MFHRVQITSGSFAGMFGTVTDRGWEDFSCRPFFKVEVEVFGGRRTLAYYREDLHLRRLDRRRRKTSTKHEH